jgi:uncharacterized surface protein with fasciclin (FAS1) repeats
MVGVGAVLFSCSGYDLDEKSPSWLGNSIYSYLNDQGNYTNFVKLIDDLNYKDVLDRTGSKTMFVSDDDAFNRFYASNSWGVKSYSDLTTAQKKLLLNGAMVNNSYQTSTLSSTEGPTEGDCMRRATAMTAYDSVPFLLQSEMPDTKYWAPYKNGKYAYTLNGKTGILCMKDITTQPMIHFLEKQLVHNRITNDDYNFLFNNTVSRKSGDASVNGVTVTDANVKCLNGFVHKMAEVITPLNNMSEIIRTTPEMSAYSKMLERYSAPYYSATATKEYNRLYNTNVDSVFQKRYFSSRSQDGAELSLDPSGAPASGELKFDPGWNQYFTLGNASISNQVAMQENMAVMLVPSNDAIDAYWNTGAGRVLKNYYGTWENVPDKVLAKLINNNMLNSFLVSVPSKFNTVLNDASLEMGLSTDNIKKVYLGCNGAIYLTDRVYSPTAYASVSFPALINESMNIIYWGIEQLEFYAYLNSMDSYYSFFIPTNEAMKNYVDPVSYGQTQTKLYRFRYDASAKTAAKRVRAGIYNYDIATGVVGDSIGDASTDQIEDRLQDILDYHTVVGNVEDGNTYYRTKGNGTIKVDPSVSGKAGQMTVQGGLQMENDTKVTVSEIYDESKEGNGKSYILNSSPLLTSRNTVYDILSSRPEFSKFLELMNGSGFFETIHSKVYACGGTNISLFNTYHYTVYVPTNESLQKLIDDKLLPTWEDVQKAHDSGDGTLEDSLTNIIDKFLRYHIQDNSIYIGSGSSEGNYETATVNPETERFFKLHVAVDNDNLTVTDNLGNVRHVVKTDGIYNRMAREYQYNNKDVAKATSLETTSWAVVHQIDGPLWYSKSEFGTSQVKKHSIKH